MAGSRRRTLFTAGTLAAWRLQALLAADTTESRPVFVACARGGRASGRPPGSARGPERVLGSLSPSPCSGPRPDTDGARAHALRAPGVVVQAAPGSRSDGGARRQWIATPATSSSGCSWSSAPWLCCSPKVSEVGLVCPGWGLRGSAVRLVSGGEVPAFAWSAPRPRAWRVKGQADIGAVGRW